MRQRFFPANLKGVLFDMDGVLFNSMPYHTDAWQQAIINKLGVSIDREIPYLNEGRTSKDFIASLFKSFLDKTPSEEFIKEAYAEKTKLFNSYKKDLTMPGINRVIGKVKEHNLKRTVVTGSGQHELLEKLNKSFPETFTKELLVTAYDVNNGKPHPEPYLKGLDKLQLTNEEVIVVENAPLGVEAAKAAKIFTVAVNTGELKDKALIDAGADLLFQSMNELAENWDKLMIKQ